MRESTIKNRSLRPITDGGVYMKINRGILERLSEIIEASGLSNRQFSLEIGQPATLVHEIFSRRVRTLPHSVILVLELKYGVNPTWLMTGKGNKWKNPEKLNDRFEDCLVGRFRRLGKEGRTLLLHVAGTLLLREEPRRGEPGSKS